MKVYLIKTKEITDYEKEIGYELILRERVINVNSPKRLYKYYVQFENADVLDGGILIGAYGDGNSIDVALIDYCQKVSNKLIVFNADDKINRREIVFPKLVHTKQLNITDYETNTRST